MSDYTLTIKFEPSFLVASRLIIRSSSDSTYIQFGRIKSYKEKAYIFNDKILLKVNDLDQLTGFLNSYKFRDNTTRDSVVTYKKTANGDSVRMAEQIMGNDGIIVYGVVNQNNTTKKFEFWSPDKGTSNEKLVKILFSILYNAYHDDISVNYFELLEQYFPHELGLKKISDNPLKYKLYGSISVDEDSLFEHFFESLPHHKKIFIDMSNFEGMGTMFDSILEDYVGENKNLYWINPTDSALIHLYESRVHNSHIISKRKIIRIEEKNGRRKIIYKDY